MAENHANTSSPTGGNDVDPILLLYGEWAALRAKASAGTPTEADNALDQADKIEGKIWATPAATLEGLLCKARMVEDWVTTPENGKASIPFNHRDWPECCASWLRMDVERMATAPKPS